MNLKQLNILINLALLLLFNFMLVYLYQFVSQKMQYKTELSQEIISVYNIQLDVGGLNKLAEKIKPSVLKKEPMMANAEPKKISIVLLNGNGIIANASLTAQYLDEKGYDVLDIKNADRQDYLETTISYHPVNEGFALGLQSDLKSYYNGFKLDPTEKDEMQVKITLGMPAQTGGGEESE